VTGCWSVVHRTVDCRIACVNYPRLDNFVTLAAEGTRIGYKKRGKQPHIMSAQILFSHDPQFLSLCSLTFFYHILIISTNLALFILSCIWLYHLQDGSWRCGIRDKRGHSTLCRNVQKISLWLTAKYPFRGGGHENKRGTVHYEEACRKSHYG
jgi:hypothetical protein